jgi:hypothetical protein
MPEGHEVRVYQWGNVAMKSGTIPSSWLAIAGSFSPRLLLKVLSRVELRGIAHTDLVAVAAVCREVEKGNWRYTKGRTGRRGERKP